MLGSRVRAPEGVLKRKIERSSFFGFISFVLVLVRGVFDLGNRIIESNV